MAMMTMLADEDLFDYLPDELVLHVFKFLPTVDVCKAASVCRRWHRLTGDTVLWKYLYLRFQEQRFERLQAQGGSLYAHCPTRLSLDLWRWRDAYRAQFNWSKGEFTVREVKTPEVVADLSVNGTIVSTTSRWDDALHIWDIANAPPQGHDRDANAGPSMFERRVARAKELAAAVVSAPLPLPDGPSEPEDSDLGELLSSAYETSAMDACHVQSVLSLSGARSRFKWFMFFPYKHGSLVAGIARTYLRVWDMESGELVHAFEDANGWTAEGVYFGSSKLVKSSPFQSSVKIYSLASGEHTSTLRLVHHDLALNDVYLVGASETVSVLDLETGDLLRSARRPRLNASIVEFDDERIITGDSSGGLVAFDMHTLAMTVIHTAPDFGIITDLVFDDVRLVVASASGSVSVWQLGPDYPLLFTISIHAGAVRRVYFDDMKIVTTGDESAIRIIDFSPNSKDDDAKASDDAAVAVMTGS
ncbi:uncharacterized protein AMSG_00502 [Thecamonas trahens ATCC 50062]|uniref:F-box domain-containing protein n=1 Tax=Thecamonas trahens ATCC 50062 TaxID=461836 RepID=A0A0L0D8M1_THETB|nr:hypothetical protein AMSG_00502 [Thecamonas trahens ATCC 50062]KNC48727.1 hypothetical protein AMSG_00502 [Thecamonas trahens ATCC 50062]|eukprot:XP_013762779.1 hypothetical protein AMSG_00502 [Thecamonas trahens ATCC 50062]